MNAESALFSLANGQYESDEEKSSLLLVVEKAVRDEIETSGDGLDEWIIGTQDWSGWTISELAQEWDSL